MGNIKQLISNKQKAALRGYVRELMSECPQGIRTTRQSDSTHVLTISWEALDKFANTSGQHSTRQRVLRALFNCDIDLDDN